MANDRQTRSGATGLVCWISVSSPRGAYVPASRCVASHPMAHSTRQKRKFTRALAMHKDTASPLSGRPCQVANGAGSSLITARRAADCMPVNAGADVEVNRNGPDLPSQPPGRKSFPGRPDGP